MLDHPTEGCLSINGMNVFEWDENKIARFRNSSIGFVFQFNNLLPEFNALENTMMPALISGMSKKQAGEKACKLLSEVGLEHRIKHKPGELSGGEQQRVAIARALVMEPEILLVDEPTGNLDTETGKKIEDILVNLNATKNITLVTVTHNKLLAERMSGRISLRDGRIYDYK
jgi:lipoprotein-releasing system ATP-binding protein